MPQADGNGAAQGVAATAVQHVGQAKAAEAEDESTSPRKLTSSAASAEADLTVDASSASALDADSNQEFKYDSRQIQQDPEGHSPGREIKGTILEENPATGLLNLPMQEQDINEIVDELGLLFQILPGREQKERSRLTPDKLMTALARTTEPPTRETRNSTSSLPDQDNNHKFSVASARKMSNLIVDKIPTTPELRAQVLAIQETPGNTTDDAAVEYYCRHEWGDELHIAAATSELPFSTIVVEHGGGMDPESFMLRSYYKNPLTFAAGAHAPLILLRSNIHDPGKVHYSLLIPRKLQYEALATLANSDLHSRTNKDACAVEIVLPLGEFVTLACMAFDGPRDRSCLFHIIDWYNGLCGRANKFHVELTEDNSNVLQIVRASWMVAAKIGRQLGSTNGSKDTMSAGAYDETGLATMVKIGIVRQRYDIGLDQQYAVYYDPGGGIGTTFLNIISLTPGAKHAVAISTEQDLNLHFHSLCALRRLVVGEKSTHILSPIASA